MNKTNRYNGKCSKCGAKYSVVAFQLQLPGSIVEGNRQLFITESGAPMIGSVTGLACPVVTCSCGKGRPILKPVYGRTVAAVKCDGRCTHATGHDCECSCGGKNHGQAFGVAS
jgi:hypothetical protein